MGITAFIEAYETNAIESYKAFGSFLCGAFEKERYINNTQASFLDFERFTQSLVGMPQGIEMVFVHIVSLTGKLGSHMQWRARWQQARLNQALEQAWQHSKSLETFLSQYMIQHQITVLGHLSGRYLMNRYLFNWLKKHKVGRAKKWLSATSELFKLLSPEVASGMGAGLVAIEYGAHDYRSIGASIALETPIINAIINKKKLQPDLPQVHWIQYLIKTKFVTQIQSIRGINHALSHLFPST